MKSYGNLFKDSLLYKEYLASIVDSSYDAIIGKDLNGIVLSWNKGAEHIFGYASEEIIGTSITRLIPGPLIMEEKRIIEAVTRGERVAPFETVRLTKTGGLIDVRITVSPIRNTEGKIIGASKIARDITESMARQREVKKLTRIYAALSEVNLAVAKAQDDAELLQKVCTAIVTQGGFRMAWAGWIDEQTHEIIPTASSGDTDEYLKGVRFYTDLRPLGLGPEGRAVRQTRTIICNNQLLDNDIGPWRNELERCNLKAIASFPLRVSEKIRAVLVVYQDEVDTFHDNEIRLLEDAVLNISYGLENIIRERLRSAAEAELQLKDHAIQALNLGLIITDPRRVDNPIIYASPGFSQMTGYPQEEIVGRNCRFLQGPETAPADVATLREGISNGKECRAVLVNYRKDGTPFWNDIRISPVFSADRVLTHFIGVQTNITEQRGLEIQLRQAQKMEAVGQLASGIAHDFNNQLTVINGYSQLLLHSSVLDAKAKKYLEIIREAGDRSAALTGGLLAFGRKQIMVSEVIDLNEVLRKVEDMLRRITGEQIELAVNTESEPAKIFADAAKIDQVLINLTLNARDAMEDGGKLSISVGRVELDGTYSKLHPETKPGPYILLSVTDTGEGMSEDVRLRIFEPFFSTKDQAQGTGLGLAIVYGIVRQSDGLIEVYSEKGYGTAFKIYFPEVEGQAPSRIGSKGAVEIVRGGETILLVEDERALLELAREILVECGYTVLTAQNGEDALKIAKSVGGGIKLLLTDVVMPGMGGRDLSEQMSMLIPKIRTVFMSGYTDDAVVRHGILYEHVHFLQKPFLPEDLARKIRDALDS